MINSSAIIMAISTIKNITPANIGAVAKTGDTMTGSLMLASGTSIYQATSPIMFFRREDDTNNESLLTAIFCTTNTVNGKRVGDRLYFRHYAHNDSGDTVGYWEQYRLPAFAGDATSSKTYEILTSKSPVTIPQGGTGATNAPTARANLGITPANIGASIFLGSSDTTAALLYNKLEDLELNRSVSIRVSDGAIQSLSGKSISGGYGTVVKGNVESGTLVLYFDICYLAGNYRHAFTTRVSQTTITPGAVYSYTGTALS